jgi:hypothetical protein
MKNSSQPGLPGKRLLQNKTIRSLLLLNTFFLVAIVGVVVLLLVGGQRQTGEISRQVIRQLSEQSTERIINFFNPIQKQLSSIRQWDQNGVLNTSRPDLLKDQLFPLISNNAQIYSLILSDTRGWSFALFRGETGWRALVTVGSDSTGRQEWWELNGQGERVGRQNAAVSFRPHRRIWFRDALEKGEQEFSITEPYRLFPDGQTGMTISLAWERANVQRVAALSVLYQHLISLVDTLKLDASSRVFVFSGQQVILNLAQMSNQPVAEGQAQTLENGRTAADSVAEQALKAWVNSGQPERPFRFEQAGMVWWAYLRRFEKERPMGLAWVVPQSALLQGYSTRPYYSIIGVLVVLWLGTLLLTVRVARRERTRSTTRDLSRMSEEELLAIIRQGESEQVEFKSTLRWNLKADKPGKEIELASLKTITAFMNSGGGFLFVGVDDDGTPLGIELDKFPNHDKYLRHFGSIFNQHIGLEFSEYLQFAIRQVQGKEIFVIQCFPSPRPVFLKNKDQEMFFIRSGPASRQLSMSQLLQYVKERKLEY